MALNGASRHQRQALTLANTLRLLKLPPYSPELSPVEHLQDDLREKSSHNRIFDSVDPLEIHLESSLRAWSSITHAYAPSLHGLALFIHSRIRNAMSRAARCSAAVTESLNAREGPDCKCAITRPAPISFSFAVVTRNWRMDEKRSPNGRLLRKKVMSAYTYWVWGGTGPSYALHSPIL